MKNLWKSGDILKPRVHKCPSRNYEIKIINVLKNKYEIRNEKNKKEIIDKKFLDSGYINETGERIFNFIKVNGEINNGKKNSPTNNKKSIKKTRKTKTNSIV
jgi:hypothetical protein